MKSSRSSRRPRPSRTSPCSRSSSASRTAMAGSGPGMNAEVEIHVGQRDSVLAVPNAALRTQRDVGSAAQVLGLNPGRHSRRCSLPTTARPGRRRTARPAGARCAAQAPALTARRRRQAGRQHDDDPDGRVIPLPRGRHRGPGPRHLRQADERAGADAGRDGARCDRSWRVWAAAGAVGPAARARRATTSSSAGSTSCSCCGTASRRR